MAARRWYPHIRDHHDHPRCGGTDRAAGQGPRSVDRGGGGHRRGAVGGFLGGGAGLGGAPGVYPGLAEPCRRADTALMLGALTPTEVRAALAASADVVKIFPASSAGASRHMKAL